MNLKTLSRLAGAALLAIGALATAPAMAHDTTAGALTIAHPHARPNLPNRPTAAYLTISNAGSEADRLVAATSDAFGTIELHTMHEHDGVMKMMPIEAVDVPAGETAALTPGGMHLMLFDAKQRFKIGDSFDAVLSFEKAGDVPVTFMVEKPKHSGKKTGHGDHGNHGSHGNHSNHGSGS